MDLRRTNLILPAFILLLSACAQPVEIIPPTTISPSLTEAGTPTVMTPTKIPAEVPANTDPALFGVLAKSEINPLASKIQEAIFIKTMDGFIANGNIIDYQIISSEVFPSSDGALIAEIYYNVRTTDTSWLIDGGTQTDGDWIQNKCNRFDFVNTEAEFQLKNRRTCN